jgi:hypothetical protein
LASHPRSRSKLTRTPWVVVILNSIVQSRSYPRPDPRKAVLAAVPVGNLIRLASEAELRNACAL